MLTTLEGLFIGGRYEINQHIATGGMAAVFRGWDHRVERPVAVKVLRQLDHADKAATMRFRREAHAAAMLHHPNVVQAYDFFEEHGCHYLIMEYVEGINLKQYLRRHGPMPAHHALSIVTQVCSALQAAHAMGFIHRDVKPHNILLSRHGMAKVTDFGIVHITHSPSVTTDGFVLGTADYIAPEQARGETLSPATDVYAVGVVLYEMVTGRLPFAGPTPVAVAAKHSSAPVVPPRQIDPSISPYIEAVALRALQKRPERRYRDATALLVAARRARLTLLAPLAAEAHTPAPAATRGQPTLHLSAPIAVQPPSVPTATTTSPLAHSASEPMQPSRQPPMAQVAVAEAPHVTEPLAGVAEPHPDRQATAVEPHPEKHSLVEEAPAVVKSAVWLSPASPQNAGEAEVSTEVPVTRSVAWARWLVMAILALALVAATFALQAWLHTHGG
jgi:serine/threonine protein kinase